jgi:hypothetical protein
MDEVPLHRNRDFRRLWTGQALSDPLIPAMLSPSINGATRPLA